MADIIDKDTREKMHKKLDAEVDAENASTQLTGRGSFLMDLARAFDLISLITLAAVVGTFVKFLGLEGAIVLGVFCVISGIGHFWGVRLCDLPYKKMRFLSSLGGRMELIYKFRSRWAEGFCSIARPLWVLGSSLLAFLAYKITGNFTCMLYAWISFTIGAIEIMPFIAELDGATTVKSMIFSYSERLGLVFMAINAVLLPVLLAIGMYLRNAGQIDYAGLIPLLIAGLQGFSEEYYKDYEVTPMNRTQMKVMGGMYVSLLVSFLVMPKLFGISAVSVAAIPMFWPTVVVGTAGILILRIVRKNIDAAIEFKRGFCGEVK